MPLKYTIPGRGELLWQQFMEEHAYALFNKGQNPGQTV